MRLRGLLALAIGVEVVSTLCLKAAGEGLPWLYAVTAAGYAVALVLLSVCLRGGMAVGLAYGVWAAGGVVLTALAAAVVYDERLGPLRVAGIAVIVVGVLLVEVGSHRATRPTRAEATGGPA
ncbi:multidrug efflux SMR transporter [Nocardioides sp. CFH 31398]|uniref:DMT family transporter n=1 Tax=Nocardioides sp. CFH 31398 TaxID=2919579 RepID=UPI001F0691E4|nr:SMR family transporter [Nocardioides sp. CFH 31398]MCH1868091.1 SMR family transporter [Nocardioides sp. CFH 31398]